MEEKIKVTNKQNLQLSAILHIPGKTIKYPAVIVLHGFGGSKEEMHIVQLTKDLAKKGICAIRFDMSGLGESEGTIENDYRLSNYLDDIDVIYNFLAMQFFVDAKCIGIVGHSMGAKAALLYASYNPHIRSVCAISPPYQMGEIAADRSRLEEWQKTGWLEKSSDQFGILNFPYEFIKDAMKHDVRKAAPKITQSKLIIWGTKDTSVLPVEAEELYDFLDPPKEAYIIKGMGHTYRNDPKILANVDSKIVSFFRESL